MAFIFMIGIYLANFHWSSTFDGIYVALLCFNDSFMVESSAQLSQALDRQILAFILPLSFSILWFDARHLFLTTL